MNKAEHDTATLLTPPGSAAIAVLRIAGPGVTTFFQKHFSRPLTPSRCIHGELLDGEVVIDDPVLILADDAQSAEIHLHGGPWVVASTLDLLRRAGFDVIDPHPGPLPLDSVDAGTLLEREVLAYLPLARTEQGIRLLLAQEQAWNTLLRGPIDSSTLDQIGDLRPMLFPPRVAIVGAPNVGKSTLANQLFAQQRSITADLPGTTRDWVGEIANLDGLPVLLVDTPGRRETDDPIERTAIARSSEVVRAAELVVEVVDASDPASPPPAHPGALIVLNKIDRAAAPRVAHDVQTVATTGRGIDDLRRAIRARFGLEPLLLDRPMAWTARHHDLLERASQDAGLLQEMLSRPAGKR